MKKIILLLFICFSIQICFAQQFEISENQHFILKNNKPFVWVGDTAWELFHALNQEDATFYLKTRAEQGFTVVQAVVLAELDGLNKPNANGDVPLLNNDPTTPNEAYFKHVDFIIDKANELGITVALLPTWGDKLFKNSWGTGPEIFNTTNAFTYGKWIAERYKNRENLIWILGGDRNPRKNSDDIAVWNAMAKGISEAYNGNDNVLISYHPQPNDEGSSEWFHAEPWFDFNMFQTGHCRDAEVYRKIERSYNRIPTKPTIDGEPIYEDHPVCFNAKEFGTTNAYDVRKAIYTSVFAGAFGFTYGCHDIWQMYREGETPVNGPHFFWKEALQLTAANQVKYLRKLLESHAFLERIPDQTCIEENNLSAYERIQATRGNNYLFVYTSIGKPFHLNLTKISGDKFNAFWLNPKNGETKEIGSFKRTQSQLFTPPTHGYGNDWLLIVEETK